MAIENYPSELSDSDTGSMSNSITPERTGIIGSTVLLATAVVTGVAHYISTTKPLMKDCITPEARLKAVPVALKALTASTMAVAGLGGMLLMSWKLFSGGRETKDSVAVSGLEEAIQYAEYQREMIRRQIREAMYPTPAGGKNGEEQSNDSTKRV